MYKQYTILHIILHTSPIYTSVLYIDSWLLFCIALPTIMKAIVFVLFSAIAIAAKAITLERVIKKKKSKKFILN